MAYENLLLDRDEAVLTITVNRPEVLNAQSRVMREELDAALAAAAEDAGVRPSPACRATASWAA